MVQSFSQVDPILLLLPFEVVSLYVITVFVSYHTDTNGHILVATLNKKNHEQINTGIEASLVEKRNAVTEMYFSSRLYITIEQRILHTWEVDSP